MCMYIYALLHSNACTYCSEILKIIVSIVHWTLLSNFHLLHHPQTLHCLKAITKYRNVHAYLCALRLHACIYHSQMFFGCIIDTSLMFIPNFIKIQSHSAEIYGFVYCPNLHVHLHVLGLHERMCMPMNNNILLRMPIMT